MDLSNYRFSRTHEWATRDASGLVVVGITQHAVELLNDLVYVELPKVGSEAKAGSGFGEIESVKAVSDLYSPVDGTVAEVNEKLSSDPMQIADDPYGKGWIVKIKPSGSLADNLLSHEEYQKLLEEDAH
jgi:glycine cleavage system H protein